MHLAEAPADGGEDGIAIGEQVGPGILGGGGRRMGIKRAVEVVQIQAQASPSLRTNSSAIASVDGCRPAQYEPRRPEATARE